MLKNSFVFGDFDSLGIIGNLLEKKYTKPVYKFVENEPFISALDTNKKFVRGDKQTFRIQMEKMRRFSGSILVDKKDMERGYNTTCLCGVKRLDQDNNPAPVALVRGVESKKLFFNGLIKCGSVWRCPVCSYKITQQRQKELYYMSSEWKRVKGQEISFITLTMRHRATFSLEKSLGILLDEFRLFQKTKLYKSLEKEHDIRGFVKTLEITYGASNGWHPHLHLLLFHKSSKDFEKLHKKILTGWVSRKRVGALIQNQRAKIVYSKTGVADYMAKMDMTKDLISRWDTTKELTRSSFKETKGKGKETRYTPFSMLRLLSLNEKECGLDDYNRGIMYSLYRIYCQATKGRHYIVVSKKLKEYFKEINAGRPMKTDAEILEDEKIDEIIFKIDIDVWDAFVKTRGLVSGYLINAFENDGIRGVLRLLFRCGFMVAYDSYSRTIYPVFEDFEDVLKEGQMIYVRNKGGDWFIRPFKGFSRNGRVIVGTRQEGGMSSYFDLFDEYSVKNPFDDNKGEIIFV